MRAVVDGQQVTVNDPALAVVQVRHGTDIETELRSFMQQTAASMASFGLSMAVLTERLTTSRDEQKSFQADMKQLPDRVTRLEERLSGWEKEQARRLAVLAIAITALSVLVPLLIKGLQSK